MAVEKLTDEQLESRVELVSGKIAREPDSKSLPALNNILQKLTKGDEDV